MSATAKKTMVTVTKQFAEGKRQGPEEESVEGIDVRIFETENVSSISVKLGLTVNLGNYESCRADVMVTVPHYEEERDDAFLYALGHCERKLQAVVGDKSEAKALVDRARKAMKG